ncbi:hypothetical protein JAAARDRAFT_51444 [Jaapia argillacea MUCL 33604]|uniref:Uncharacterized protein n=1 Tax=Jaapia argillacea MUCL 33604 TaxID=933084 RepID=A0A067P568_9AGAM|nr:hypothetical protein JAAARDRAFT_51444 [Jaapia argillacea MUCL 33604]
MCNEIRRSRSVTPIPATNGKRPTESRNVGSVAQQEREGRQHKRPRNLLQLLDQEECILPPSELPTPSSPTSSPDFATGVEPYTIVGLGKENDLLRALVGVLRSEKEALKVDKDDLKTDKSVMSLELGILKLDVAHMRQKLQSLGDLQDEIQELQLSLEASEEDAQAAKDDVETLEDNVKEYMESEGRLRLRLQGMVSRNEFLEAEVSRLVGNGADGHVCLQCYTLADVYDRVDYSTWDILYMYEL